MNGAIPRFLLPDGLLFRRHQLQFLHRNLLRARQPTQSCRQVTGNPSAKLGPGPKKHEMPTHFKESKEDLVLAKPDKYRPPSHGRRLKEQIPRNYGPELTMEQKAEQKTKQYPNSPPPHGTWLYWILMRTNLHAKIAMTTLFSLAAFTTFENWRRDTVFKSQLPSLEDLFSHPIKSFWKTFYLIRLDVFEDTVNATYIYDHKINDVYKKNTWRKHHGIEDKQGVGPWMPAEERLRVWKEKRAAEGNPVEEVPKRAPKLWMGINWQG